MTLQEALKTKQKIKRDSWTSKELYLYLDNNSYLCTKEYHGSRCELKNAHVYLSIINNENIQCHGVVIQYLQN